MEDDVSDNSDVVHIPFTNSTVRFTHVKYFTQISFAASAIASSIVFISLGSNPAIWIPVLTGTIGYIMPAPSPL